MRARSASERARIKRSADAGRSPGFTRAPAARQPRPGPSPWSADRARPPCCSASQISSGGKGRSCWPPPYCFSRTGTTDSLAPPSLTRLERKKTLQNIHLPLKALSSALTPAFRTGEMRVLRCRQPAAFASFASQQPIPHNPLQNCAKPQTRLPHTQ